MNSVSPNSMVPRTGTTHTGPSLPHASGVISGASWARAAPPNAPHIPQTKRQDKREPTDPTTIRRCARWNTATTPDPIPAFSPAHRLRAKLPGFVFVSICIRRIVKNHLHEGLYAAGGTNPTQRARLIVAGPLR